MSSDQTFEPHGQRDAAVSKPGDVVYGPIEDLQIGPHYVFNCPGCGGCHWFRTDPSRAPHWTWNGDKVRPTLAPSILAGASGPYQCHSFVRDGQIQFLPDCWHPLAGQTVPLPPWGSR